MFVHYKENVTKYRAKQAWNFNFINKIISELSFHLPTYYYSFNCLLCSFSAKQKKIIIKKKNQKFDALLITNSDEAFAKIDAFSIICYSDRAYVVFQDQCRPSGGG